MTETLNLSSLVRRLREAKEDLMSQRTRGEVNPYLLKTIVPLLEQGIAPRLADIDFDAFELYDIRQLIDYFQKQSWDSYQLRRHTDKLCQAAPAWAQARAFL